jgi:FAD/FMN-containing dehydrogenase
MPASRPWQAAAHAELERALRKRVRGEVQFDAGSRALYASTGSNYRMPPIGVVLPVDADDVIAVIEVCRTFAAPVLPRGGGTSLAGQSVNTAVVIDCSRHMTRVLALDPTARLARVQPGCVLDDLRRAAELHALTFAPDPATHAYCTLGGMIGNNSCGVHSVMGGRTVDNVDTLDVLTYDGLRLTVGRTSDAALEGIIASGGRHGAIYSALKQLRDRYADHIRRGFPTLPRRISGYNLDELLPERGFHVARALVGSEGTCVTVLEATTHLLPSPPARVLLVLGYPDVFLAADQVPLVLDAGPIGLEGLDDRLVADMTRKGLHAANLQLLPDGRGWLLVEFGADTAPAAEDAARRLMARLATAALVPAMRLFVDPTDQHALWSVRESGLGATANVPGQPLTWEGWEDAAVPPAALGRYLREFRSLLERYQYRGDLYGHFGDGCVHTRIDFDFRSGAGVARYRSFVEAAADLVVRHGGSLSGEHGDGQARGELLPRMFGPELIDAFRAFKRIWDPDAKMNPGKKIDANRLDDNLRLGESYRPSRPVTHFAFTPDGGNFSRTALRCVGVGASGRPVPGRCVRAIWRPATRSTRRAVARACCSRCCRATSSRVGGRMST